MSDKIIKNGLKKNRILDFKAVSSDIKELAKVSNIRAIYVIILQWAIIFATIFLALRLDHWATYYVGVIIIGTRQHALGILMHDAAHYRICKNRLANDVISDLFLAFPLWVSTTVYRKRHLAHHQYTLAEKDPDYRDMRENNDWQWPKKKNDGLKVLLKNILGINGWQGLALAVFVYSPVAGFLNPHIKDDASVPRWQLRMFLGFVAVLFITLTITGHWVTYLLLWFLPQSTVLWGLFYLRSLAEHSAVENTNKLNESRTVIPTFLEKLIIAPCNVNYHLDHHLFPHIPFYNLHKLHERLMEERDFRENAHITKSYLGIKKQGLIAELFSAETV